MLRAANDNHKAEIEGLREEISLSSGHWRGNEGSETWTAQFNG
jgi:hypothetical protein